MRIFIVGLGLMGASYAEALTMTDHQVFGYDQNPDVMDKAKNLSIIDASSNLSIMSTVDLVILALYPKDNVEFVKQNINGFKAGQLVTDLAGTKSEMMNKIESLLPFGVSYLSHHPMAGREISGFEARNPNMFDQANFLIVRGKRSRPKDMGTLIHIANDLKFGKITVMDADAHDQLIAFTSQLTHILAVTLIQSDNLPNTKLGTGDSFRDLTRIAKINETMWSELFLENKDALLACMSHFESTFNSIKQLIETEDQEGLKTFLKEAKEKRQSFDTD